MYALCWTDESRPHPCPRQGPTDSPRRGPRPCRLAEPRRKSWQNETGGNSNAATVATVGAAAKMVGVATTTTTAGVTAVVEAGEAHRARCGSGRHRGGNFGPTTGAVGRSSGEGNGGCRNGARGRSAWAGSSTSSRSSSFSSTDDHSEVAVVAGKRCQEPWQDKHLGLRLSPFCCVC